jgi:F1F0 ATPase subunit 2
MSEIPTVALAGLAGALLGAIFFGGLWWTVGHGVSARRPALLFVTSVVLRMGITLVGFYFVSGGQWKRLVACLVGFVIARTVVTWLVRAGEKLPKSPDGKANHAP